MSFGGESNIGGAIGSGGTTGNPAISLVVNGSFEMDQEPAELSATAPPSGWSMVSSNRVGNLLHAEQSDGKNDVPPAFDGYNVARFDSLTSTSYREAQSECFVIDTSKAISVGFQVRIPEQQLPPGTKAAVKLWYYQDLTCATPSALRESDTQTAASNTSAGVWEQRQYQPSQNPPTDGVAARVSIRGAYVAGSNCGDAGIDCTSDRDLLRRCCCHTVRQDCCCACWEWRAQRNWIHFLRKLRLHAASTSQLTSRPPDANCGSVQEGPRMSNWTYEVS